MLRDGPPRGYDAVAALSLSDGEFTSWTRARTGGRHRRRSVRDGAQIVLEGRLAVRLKVRCSGRSTVEVTSEQIDRPASVQCPADQRVEPRAGCEA